MGHNTKWTRAFVTKVIVLVVILLISIQYLVNVAVFRQTGPIIFIKVFDASVEKILNQSMAVSHLSMRTVLRSTTSKPDQLCPVISPKLKGFRKPNLQVAAWSYLAERNSDVLPGGRYAPPDCQSRHKVAIVIPFRDREIHLKIFLRNMHPFLKRQQLDYGIFVIEMARNITFNRALLMNVGFAEAMKRYQYDCFIFHDVDLLPEDDRNLYTCPESPRHMSVAIDRLKYALPYSQIFGGVSAIPTKDFQVINGFSNIFFGWGGEDDDMYRRIIYSNLTVVRYSPQVARYKMLVHAKDHGNKERFALLRTVKARRLTDGLNSLKYHVIKSENKPLYTWILISVNETEVLESEPIHKIVLKNLLQKTNQTGGAVQTMPSSPDKNKSAQAPAAGSGVVNDHNSSSHNSNTTLQHKSKTNVKTSVWSSKKAPRVINWIPNEFKGELPQHLSHFKPLPLAAKLKAGPHHNEQVQGLLKTHTKINNEPIKQSVNDTTEEMEKNSDESGTSKQEPVQDNKTDATANANAEPSETNNKAMESNNQVNDNKIIPNNS